MTKKKITQKEAIFYILYRSFKENPGEYIPVFKFMGEVYCPEVGKWGFVSHECSARASELRSENPGLIDKTVITGKSGAKYYGYRFSANAKPELIKDKNLHVFYQRIKPKPKTL